MVAIADEVELADLVKLDRRQIPVDDGRQPGDFAPPLAGYPSPGKEGSGETLVAAYAAHDLVQGHILEAEIACVVQVQAGPHLIKRQQVALPLHQGAQNVL